MGEKGGFSLIELIVVTFVIMVLAVVSIVYYNEYRERAVSKKLLTVARGCGVNIIGECLINNGYVEREKVEGCDNRMFEDTGVIVVNWGGCCTKFEVEAVGSKVIHYESRCFGNYTSELECEIVRR